MHVGIKVKVFYLEGEDALQLEDLGVEIKLEDCVLKTYTLYNIDFVTEYDKKYCSVSCGGEDFLVNETMDSVNKRISESRNFLYNYVPSLCLVRDLLPKI